MDSTMRFDDQVAVITGGGGALGGAYARLLASRGARVLVNDLGTATDGTQTSTPQSAQRVVDDVIAAGGIAIADTHDVVEESGSIIQAAIDAWGKVDIVIANAGVGVGGTIGDVSIEDFERGADISYRGTTRLLHYAWPHLSATRGRAVLTSSGSVFGTRLASAYTSAKSAMIGLTKTLGMDGEAAGVRVNAIMPCSWSRMMARMPEPFRSMVEEHYKPEHIANFVAWLVHDSIDVSGETFSVGAGFAGRVFMGVGWGWADPNASPEDFRDHASEICDISGGFFLPKDSGDEINKRSDRAIGFHADTAALH